MSRRLVTILLIALVVATGASYLVYQMVKSRMTGNTAQAVTYVLVAKRDLPVGTLVSKDDIAKAPWMGALPKGALTKEEDAIGRGVVTNLYMGEPILDSRLAKPGAGGGLAAIIPPGMRAAAVRVNEVVGVAGFVLPGMRVDVLITGNPPGGQGTQGPQSKTILQNVEVLSAGQNLTKDEKGTPVQVPVVNLLVTPEQAEILSLATNESKIQLVLRNPLDQETAQTKGKSLSSLFMGEQEQKKGESRASTTTPRRLVAAAKPVPPAVKVSPPLPPPERVIDVINGPRKEQVKFTNPEEQQALKPQEVRQ